MRGWAILPLRIGLGAVFVAHGLQKAFGLFGGSGIEGLSRMLSGLGFVPASLWAHILAYVELLCGVCLLIGFLVRISSGLLLVVMLVAILKVHLANGFLMMSGGYEYNFVIICICIALLIAGQGSLSMPYFKKL